MIQIFLKRSFRSFLNNKIFSAINIIGISIGLTIAYFAINFISFEYSYDTSHSNSDNIFRLARKYRSQDYSVIGFQNWNATEGAEQKNWINTLQNVEGVANATHFMISPAKEFLEGNDKRIECEAILTTNTANSFIETFDWEVLDGNLKNFASGNDKIIITQSIAESLFGKLASYSSYIDKTLKILDKNLQLSAIIQDVPENSHFDFSVAINSNKIEYWGSRVYLEVLPEVSIASLQININKQVALYSPRLASDPLYSGHILQPIADIHLKSNILYESKQPGNYTYIFLIGLFAFFTLFIAIFNYSNLTLAIKSRQNKALGVLKTMGAASGNLVLQFIGEAVLQAMIAIPIALVLIYLASPYFNDLMGINISNNFTGKYNTGLLLTGLAIVIGLIASLAPIILLAGKSTVLLFKNGLQTSNFQGLFVRKYLIIAQFIFLIVISAIAYFTSQQLEFINQKDLGFRKDQIVFAYTSENNQNAFQEKLKQIPEITHVGNGSTLGIRPFNQGTYKIEGSETVFDDSGQLYLDFNALKAYDIKTDLVIEAQSTRKTIINRTAADKLAKTLNIPVSKIIGKTITTEPEYRNPENGQVGFPFVIDGIFEDIHLFSLREKIEPYFITLSEGVRMDGRTIIAYNSSEAINKIQKAFKELNESIPLELDYLDENINQLYEQENRLNSLLIYFNFIAILLGSLGIIGVTIFLTNIKIKEIGIRKILGATPISVATLSIKEYIPLVLIALGISFPIVYLLINKWLEEFAYKFDIQYITIFPIGLGILLIIGFLVGAITLKAANRNPVETLRSE